MNLVSQKLARAVATLLAVSFITFMLTSLLPGDPAIGMLGPGGVTPQAIAAVRAELGLNHPLPIRYWLWLEHALRGNLGYSFVSNVSVRSELTTHLPVTLEIIVLAMVISLVLAVPGGIVSAARAGRPIDQVTSGLSFVLLAVPSFVMALLLILLFAVKVHLFPASGWTPLTQNPLQNLRGAFLPSLALALPQVAIFLRLLRGDIVALAQAKGISNLRVLLRHAFRISSLSLVTIIGLQVGFLLGGTVIVENLFSLPGIGSVLVQSIISRDLVTVQGLTLFISVAFVLVNLSVDLLYTVIDPRIRRGHTLATV
jgi:peptide/nickel transport system permease protein